MLKTIAVSLALIVLSGCGMISTKPITDDKFTELKGKSLAVTKPIGRSTSVLTIGGALVAGLTVFNSSEDDLTTTFKIADPAINISKRVSESLIKKSKIKLNAKKALKEESRDAEEIISQFPKSDYVLDINTVFSMFSYKPFDFGSYKLAYTSKLQLFEASTKMVVAESICAVSSDDEQSISYDDFLDNDAKLLKLEFKRAEKLCTEQFSKEILKV
jgi:hypothetical protein